MCWISHSYTTLKVAPHDIPVFKICRRIRNRIVPYYQYFNLEYLEGKTYVKKGKIQIENFYGSFCVDEGFHSYRIGMRKLAIDTEALLVNGVIPAITSSYSKGNSVIALCIIPKDSTYVINNIGEYVSDGLKVVRFLDDYTFSDIKSIKRLNEEIISFGENIIQQIYLNKKI